MLPDNPGKERGVNVVPRLKESAFSGLRCVLPPNSCDNWLPVPCGMDRELYCAAETPVRMHCCRVAAMAPEISLGAQGSSPEVTRPTTAGLYNSIKFGARIARW